MKAQVELLKISKEGSPYSKSSETVHVLVLPRGRKLNIGDPVVGLYGMTEIESVSEKDPFISYIYYLKEGTSLVNPRKIVGFEEDLDQEFIQKEKDLEGPFYIEIENDQVLKESGKIKIFR
jgi:hypothetical protein